MRVILGLLAAVLVFLPLKIADAAPMSAARVLQQAPGDTIVEQVARRGGARVSRSTVHRPRSTVHRSTVRGPRGTVHRKTVRTNRGTVHSKTVRRGNRVVHNRVVVRPVRPWVRRPYYGRVISGVALGTIIAASVVPIAPGPNLCWYWNNPNQTRGYWDYCRIP